MPKSVLKKIIKSSKKPRKSKGKSKKKVIFSSKPVQVKYMSPGSKRYANHVPDGEIYLRSQNRSPPKVDYLSLFPNQEKAKKAIELERIKRAEEENKRSIEKAKNPFKIRALMENSNNSENNNNNWE